MKIVNKHSHVPTEHDVYIGRGSAVGNPYKIGEVFDGRKLSRNEGIYLYRLWLIEKVAELNEEVIEFIDTLDKEANLVCFCSPNTCHGEIVMEIWSGWHGHSLPI